MRKIFLIFMLCLLPLQYTWAMVASYDTHDVHDTEMHFGHHEHQTLDSHADHNVLTDNAKNDKNTQKAKIHEHFGYLHMSSGELLSHDLPSFTAETNQYLNQNTSNHHSPPTYKPERPNWLAAV